MSSVRILYCHHKIENKKNQSVWFSLQAQCELKTFKFNENTKQQHDDLRRCYRLVGTFVLTISSVAFGSADSRANMDRK